MSQTCCVHRRYVGECGECERRDIQMGSNVQVADDGTGSQVTWFDGVVTDVENGRVVVDAEPFGAGVWDRVKPIYTDVIRVMSQPVVQGSGDTKQSQPSTAAPTSLIPLAAPLEVGTKVTVASADIVNDIFRKHGWTVSREAQGRIGQQATITSVDKADRTVKLTFVDGGIVGQWWPFEAVAVTTDEGKEQAERIESFKAVVQEKISDGSAQNPNFTPEVRKEVRAEVEDALAAANSAAELYTTPEGSIDNCGHGNLRTECGKCPRLELKVGDKICAAERNTDVWFKGVVTQMHEFGYPTLRVDNFSGEAVWDRVKKHVTKADLGCPHKLVEELCGRCSREDLALNEAVKVSVDGENWSDGIVVGRAYNGAPKVALKGQTVGFGWDFVGPMEAKVKQMPVPATMQKCKHNRIEDVCGQCPRQDLKRGMRVKAAMDGSNQDTAVFDGIVATVTPDGPVVKVPAFDEMTWDRVWLATYTKPLDLYGDAERVKKENEKRRAIEEQAALLPPRSDFDTRTSDTFREQLQAREQYMEQNRQREEDRKRREEERLELEAIVKRQAQEVYEADVVCKPAKVPLGGGNPMHSAIISELEQRNNGDGLIKPAKVPLRGSPMQTALMGELQQKIRTPTDDLILPGKVPPMQKTSTPVEKSIDGLIKPTKVPLGSPMQTALMGELQQKIRTPTDDLILPGKVPPVQKTSTPVEKSVDGLIKPAKVPHGGSPMQTALMGELQKKTRTPIEKPLDEDGLVKPASGTPVQAALVSEPREGRSPDSECLDGGLGTEHVPLPQPTKRKPKKRAGRKAPTTTEFTA